jgi:hypothetical protein
VPIFLKNKILFIHIPKNGGTSIEAYMKNMGDKMDLWMYSNRKNFYLLHTEQHYTFKEIVSNKKYSSEYRIFSIIRHPIDRVLSEYNYIVKMGKTRYKDFNIFLDSFLNKNNFRYFDNHNLSNFDYLSNEDGEISDKIKIFKFFDEEGISNFIGAEKQIGHFNISTKVIKEITDEQKERILDFYKDDIHCFDFDINSPILIRNKNLKNL